MFKGWAEDLSPTQRMGTESPATSQARASTPVKRSASFMQESPDFSQTSPSPKRVKLIQAAFADGGFSDHSGPPITSPNALQPSPSGSQPFSRYYVSKSMS